MTESKRSHRRGRRPAPASPDLVDALERCERVLDQWTVPGDDEVDEQWIPPVQRPGLVRSVWRSLRYSRQRPYLTIRLLVGYALLGAAAAAVGFGIVQLVG